MDHQEDINFMLHAAKNKDFTGAKQILGQIMSAKLQKRLDEEKIRQGSKLFDKKAT